MCQNSLKRAGDAVSQPPPLSDHFHQAVRLMNVEETAALACFAQVEEVVKSERKRSWLNVEEKVTKM
jgi:hypothetical protein